MKHQDDMLPFLMGVVSVSRLTIPPCLDRVQVGHLSLSY